MRNRRAVAGLLVAACGTLIAVWAITKGPSESPLPQEEKPGQSISPNPSAAPGPSNTEQPSPSDESPVEADPVQQRVRVRVSGENGVAIEGAFVEVVPEWDFRPDVYPHLAEFGPQAIASGLTNEEGVASLSVGGRGRHFVVARRGIDAMTIVVLDGSDRSVELALAFPPAAIADSVTVAGRAFGDGVVLPNTKILCRYGADDGGIRFPTVQTDTAGRFILRGLPGPGTGSALRMRTEGYVPLERWPTEEPGSVLVDDFHFSSGSRVTGRLVVPAGLDPGSVDMEIGGWGWPPTIQASGEYRFQGLLPGETTICARLLGYAEQCIEVVVPRTGEVRAPDLRFGFGATIRGVLRSQKGEPLSKEYIDLCPPGLFLAEGHGSASVETDADGAFQIRSAAPGNYSLVLTTMDRDENPRLATITVRPGEDSIGPLRLTVPVAAGKPRLGRIRGRALGPGGQLRQVAIRWEPDWRGIGGVTGINERGEFELQARVGRVRLMAIATAPGSDLLTLAPVEVDLGDEPLRVDLRLSKGATVSGRVSPNDRVEAEGVRVRLESLDEPDSLRSNYRWADQQIIEDTYRLSGILPGRYAVIVYADRRELPWSWELRREVDLVAGQEARADFQLGLRGVSSLKVQLGGLPSGLEVVMVRARWKQQDGTPGRSQAAAVPATFDFVPAGPAVLEFGVETGTKSERTTWTMTRPVTVGSPPDSGVLVQWPALVGAIEGVLQPSAQRRRLLVKGAGLEVKRLLIPFAASARVDHLPPGSYRCWIGDEDETVAGPGVAWTLVDVTAGGVARFKQAQ